MLDQIYFVSCGTIYPVDECDQCGVDYADPCNAAGAAAAKVVDEACLGSFDMSSTAFRCEQYGSLHKCLSPPILESAYSMKECWGTASGESCGMRCLPGYVPTKDTIEWCQREEFRAALPELRSEEHTSELQSP